MPTDPMEKVTASPIAGAPASGAQTPDKPKNASEHRKSSKPIMEKRRRARINESLGQLKTLILDALKKDSSRHSKLEKADILEMTVKHLRNLQRAQITAHAAEAHVLSKYRAGFSECMNEVTRFLSGCEGVNAEVKARLLAHLSGCLGQMMVAMGYPQPGAAALQQHVSLAQPLNVQLPVSGVPVSCKLSPAEALSPTKVYGGFQFVPATDGQFAFLIPAPSSVLPVYANSTTVAVPVSGSSSPAGAPPVQGLTCFTAVARNRSPVGGMVGSEIADNVWRPW
ncbi:transcription factor HES-4-like [Scleropages formosus]|uniref:Hairy-related 9 n=1 Tax=Scleropages formosus TaxID=113540 RepID=A0A8C9TAY4_SCLFO|nr:transcription factor HES-4-like [Scleropages formosus]